MTCRAPSGDTACAGTATGTATGAQLSYDNAGQTASSGCHHERRVVPHPTYAPEDAVIAGFEIEAPNSAASSLPD